MIDLTDRDPFIAEAAALFAYNHLPPHLQESSRPFHDLAEQLLTKLGDSRQLLLALDHLVAAKDCAVRAAVAARCEVHTSAVVAEPTPPRPTIGRIVNYILSEGDVEQIDTLFPRDEVNRNRVAVGDVVTGLVVRVFDPNSTTCNLRLFLDGAVDHWVTSRQQGDEPGRWRWPTRV